MSAIYSGGFYNSIQLPEPNADTRRRSRNEEFVQSLAFGSLARANSKIPERKG